MPVTPQRCYCSAMTPPDIANGSTGRIITIYDIKTGVERPPITFAVSKLNDSGRAFQSGQLCPITFCRVSSRSGSVYFTKIIVIIAGRDISPFQVTGGRIEEFLFIHPVLQFIQIFAGIRICRTD